MFKDELLPSADFHRENLEQRVLNELRAVNKLAPYIPKQIIEKLNVQLGMARLIQEPRTISSKLVVLNNQMIPEKFQQNGKIIIDHQILSSDLELIIHILQARNETLHLLTLPRYFEPGLAKPSLSHLHLYSSQTDKIVSYINSLHYLFLTKESFYQAIPNGEILQGKDRPSFWVQELPLCDALIYTEAGSQLGKQFLLKYSNLLHEIGAHMLMGKFMPIRFISTEGEQLQLNAKTVLPIWLWEGSANVLVDRFMPLKKFRKAEEEENDLDPEGLTDFVDLFLQSWDGIIPKSDQIVGGDESLPYFFHTLFCAFVFQAYGYAYAVGHGQARDPNWFKQPLAKDMTSGLHQFITCTSVIPPIPLPLKAKNIQSIFTENIFNFIRQFQQKMFQVAVPTFQELRWLFNQHRYEYTINWINDHFTPEQKALAMQKISKNNQKPN